MQTSGQKDFIYRIKKALGHLADDRQRPVGDRVGPSDERVRRADLFDLPMSQEDRDVLRGIGDRTSAQKQKLLTTLIEAAKPINLNVIALADESAVAAAIVELVQQKEPEWGEQKSVVCWKHALIERLNLAEGLESLKVPVYFAEGGDADGPKDVSPDTRKQFRQHVIDSYIGLTSADFCMADTATLVMRTRPGQARSVSLVPSIHIAVIGIDQLVGNLKELVALLKWDSGHQTEGLTNCMTFISGPSKTADIEATMVHGAHGPREVYIYVITGPEIAATVPGPRMERD
jgi:L-lactate dehydrogenase complex protein LldG